uniref:FXYD domain-containing ion transport regulator n=1 Tax=Labrus bergylta TaxID=56723 RepID=A0A3Q3EK71_9LABR
MATTESMFPDRSDFDYDYETLRTTGVILAVIMFVSGILIALSKKFTKCVKSSSNTNSSGTQIPKTEGEFTVLEGAVEGHSVCQYCKSMCNIFPLSMQCLLKLYRKY